MEAVLTLFEPDAIFSVSFFGEQTRTEWEQALAWEVAQGTVLSPPDCTVTMETAESVFVSCIHGQLDALTQAVDGPPVPIDPRLIITPDDIGNSEFSFGQPDFNTVGDPFDEWILENHPEDAEKLEFGNWTSIEEAEENGILTAQYAQEWGAYLEVNGYTYNEACIVAEE